MNNEPPGGTVTHLLWAYRKKALPKLRERTQADYRKWLDVIDDRFGALSLRAMSSEAVARHIIDWRDEAASSPRQADYRIQVLSALLGWGVKERLLAKNLAVNIPRLYRSDRREVVWSLEQETALLNTAPEPICRAYMLAVESGQRQGDLLRLPWSSIKGRVIKLRQLKTGVHVAVPISPALRACLDACPKGLATTILTTEKGLPWDPKGNGFRAAWHEACAGAGVTGVTFHDLRGTFVTRRLAAGFTAQDVAFCTGHSLRDLATLERYVNREDAAEKRAEAMADRLAGYGK